MGLLELLSTNELVAQLISFIILFAILRAFVWKKFLKLLDDRRERLASELKGIEDAKADVSRMKTEYDKMLSIIEETARAKKEEALADAKRIAEVIKLNAQAESEKIMDNANAAIKEELVKAREELKEELVGLTIRVAEKVIEERLTEKDDRKIIEGFMNKLEGA